MRFSKFILIIFIIILIHILIKVFLEKSSEDNYYHEKYIDNQNKFPSIKIKFRKKKHLNNFKNNISKYNICDQFNQNISNLKVGFILSENDILNNQSKYIHFKIYNKIKTIYIEYNPFYINKSDLINLLNYIINQKWLNLKKSLIKPISLNILYKFFKHMNNFLNMKITHPLLKSTQINHLYRTYKFNINSIDNKNLKNYIIYLVIKQISKCLEINRPIRIFLPTYYQRLNKINNNLGGIFILYSKNDSFDYFNKYFNSCKYMDYLTNLFLVTKINKFILNTKNIRQKIDIVIDYYSLNLKYNFNINHIYQNELDEPIYINIFNKIIGNKSISNISYTICTSSFNKQKYLTNEKFDII